MRFWFFPGLAPIVLMSEHRGLWEISRSCLLRSQIQVNGDERLGRYLIAIPSGMRLEGGREGY